MCETLREIGLWKCLGNKDLLDRSKRHATQYDSVHVRRSRKSESFLKGRKLSSRPRHRSRSRESTQTPVRSNPYLSFRFQAVSPGLSSSFRPRATVADEIPSIEGNGTKERKVLQNVSYQGKSRQHKHNYIP
jgi:hypothetical protein